MSQDPVAIPSQTVGPFFHFGLPDRPGQGRVAGPSARGQRIWLSIRVLDGEGEPVPDAMVEIWHADGDGRYPPARQAAADDDAAPDFTGFGRLATDVDGFCTFETVRPGYAGPPEDGVEPQAPHINICLFARGLQRQLHTRLYFRDDPGLDTDPVLALVPPDRRSTLLAAPVATQTDLWSFDLRLQGDGETVFFDL